MVTRSISRRVRLSMDAPGRSTDGAEGKTIGIGGGQSGCIRSARGRWARESNILSSSRFRASCVIMVFCDSR